MNILHRAVQYRNRIAEKYGDQWDQIATSRRFYGVRASSIIEVLVYIVFLFVLDFLFGSGERFFFVYPHPGWIILLLVVVQYSTKEAMVAAFLLTVYLLLGNIPDQSVDQSIYDYLMMIVLRPILWFSTATFLGGLHERQLTERDELRFAVENLEGHQKTLTESYNKLKGIKETLETKLVGQMRSSSVAYDAIKRVEMLSPGPLLMSIGDIVQKVLNPEKFSIYSLGDKGLEPLSCVGWGENEGYCRRFAVDTSVFKSVVLQGQVISTLWPKDREFIGEEGLLAAPLIDPNYNTVFGMIKIEAMPFDHFSLSTLETLRVLCEWIGNAYGTALKFAEAQENTVINLENQQLSHGFYRWQLRILKQLGKQVQINFVALSLDVKYPAGTSLEEKKQHSTFISNVIAGSVPRIAGIYDGKHMYREFCIIAHLAPEETIEIISENLVSSLSSQEALNPLKFKVHGEYLNKRGKVT